MPSVLTSLRISTRWDPLAMDAMNPPQKAKASPVIPILDHAVSQGIQRALPSNFRLDPPLCSLRHQLTLYALSRTSTPWDAFGCWGGGAKQLGKS